MTFEEQCTAFQALADNKVAEIVRDVLARHATELLGARLNVEHQALFVTMLVEAGALCFEDGCEHGAMTALAPAGATH